MNYDKITRDALNDLIKYSDKIKKEYDFIPMFMGRPERDAPINDHDIIDLTIILQTSKDVNDIIERC